MNSTPAYREVALPRGLPLFENFLAKFRGSSDLGGKIENNPMQSTEMKLLSIQLVSITDRRSGFAEAIRLQNEEKVMRKRKQQATAESGGDKSQIHTTVQGCEATFVKIKGHTSLFFGGFEEPSEIKEAEFLASCGSRDLNFAFGLLAQLANVSPRRRQLSVTGYEDEAPDVEAFNSLFAYLRAMAPRDPLDAIICAETGVFDSLSMMFSDCLNQALVFLDMESEAQSYTKLSRRFTAVSEALERHRSYLSLEHNGRDGKIGEAHGVAHELQNPDFVANLFKPLTHIGTRDGLLLDNNLHFARSFVTGMAPRDLLEAKRCVHMAIAHSWVMFFAHRLTYGEDWSDMSSSERSLNSFSRTFCAQTEAFDRHRYSGSRKIRVREASLVGARAIADDIHHQNGAKMLGKFNGHASS
ncbi:MAG: hypothetical protein WB528_27990 [Bradyrhizobium sp.]